jgi:hypothetical protein
MQVTTLNKIINLFLIGTFVVFLACVEAALWNPDINIDKLQALVASLGSPIFVFIATLFSLSTIILLGIIVDALTNMSIRPLIKKLSESDWFMYYLQSQKYLAQYQYLKSKSEESFKAANKYECLLDAPHGRPFPVALFFHTANKENIEWVIQHYSVYLLASSYLFMLCLGVIIIPLISMAGWVINGIIILVSLLSIYVLSYEACRKYIYAYEVIYRHNTIVLCDELVKEKAVTSQ